MPMIVVGREKTLEALDRRLFRDDAPEKDKKALRREIQELNPGVDIDDLRSGLVLNLPRSPHLRARSGADIDDMVAGGVEQLMAASAEILVRHRELVAVRGKDMAARRRETAKQLGSAKTRRILEQYPELAEAADTAIGAMLEDAEDDLQRAEAAEKAAAGWDEQLSVLQRLVP